MAAGTEMKKLTLLKWGWLLVDVITSAVAVFGLSYLIRHKDWVSAGIYFLWAAWQWWLLFDWIRENRCCQHHTEVMVGDCGDKEVVAIVGDPALMVWEISVKTLKVKCCDCGRVRLHRPNKKEIAKAISEIERGKL